jgi:phosphoheptose isomerase
MKKLIALISEHASPLASLGGVDSGGQNVYVAEIGRHLTDHGWRVDIFTRWDNANLPEVIEWLPDVRVIHVKAGPIAPMEKEYLYDYMAEFTQHVMAFISKENVEYALVHANFWMSAMVASDLKKMLQIPFVVTFHALGYIRKMHQRDKDKFPSERIDIEKQIVRDADHIIAECPQDREDLMRYYQAPQGKITIIPCGFNPHEFYPMDQMLARMVLNLDTREPIILQLGRIVPRKGIDNVIRALATLNKNSSRRARLIVVGGESETVDLDANPEFARLHAIACDEGMQARVTFTGKKQRDILKYYYAAADVFVTTPWYEPFGITPLEAMACGTPVIGSNVGGIKYSVEDRCSGFLVPPDDPDALAVRIQELLHDEGLRATMRQNAIARVNALFTWSRITERIALLYERIEQENCAAETDVACVKFVRDAFDEAAATFVKSKRVTSIPILQTARLIARCFRNNRKVLICGNGGSAAESQHFAAELVGRFEIGNRKALPALALTSDTAVLTAWANDIGYDEVFARQVQAFGEKGDVLFCFSTSGQSPNVIKAMKAALSKGMTCVSLTGKKGGDMSLYAHINLLVPSGSTQRIQELHLHVLHTVCALVEQDLFGKNSSMMLNGNGHARQLNGNNGLKVTG